MYVWLLIATPYWTFWSLEGEWRSPTRSFAGQVFQMLLWRFVAARAIGQKSGRGPGYLLVQEWAVLLLSLALAAVRKFIVTELKWLTLCIYIYICIMIYTLTMVLYLLTVDTWVSPIWCMWLFCLGLNMNVSMHLQLLQLSCTILCMGLLAM